VWALASLIAALLFLASLPYRHNQLLNLSLTTHSQADILRSANPEAIRMALAQLDISMDLYATYTLGLEVLSALVFCTVALVIANRRTDPLWSMFVSGTLILFGTTGLPTIGALAQAQPALEPTYRLLNGLGWTFLGVLFYTFPNGQFIPSWTRPMAALWILWQLSWTIYPDIPINPLRWPPLLALLVWMAWLATGAYAQSYRYFRVSGAIQRQQTKWVACGLTASGLAGSLANLPTTLFPTLAYQGSAGPIYELLRAPATYLFTLLVPISIGIAILRYRLFDVDLLINRTLVYIPLTAILGGLYTTSITFSQRLFVAFTGERSDAPIVITTLVVASLATPIKNSLQARVDSRFKEPPDPTRSLRDFGDQVRSVVQVIDAQKITRRALEEAATAFQAECGAVHLLQEGEWRLIHSRGQWSESRIRIRVPLESEGVQVGRLSLGARRDGLEYTSEDRDALHRTATLVAEAVRLAERDR
jgi:hypothetical protein